MIQKMYAEIHRQRDSHSIVELCKIYGISRSGYYKWLKRQGEKNRYEKTQDILDACVGDIHAHHPKMGYRSIRDILILEHGWVVSDPTVLKSMQRLNIKGYFQRTKYSKYETGLLHSRFPNLLKTYNAIQSMSRAGTPRDNAVMESFWRRFKDTLRIHFRYRKKDDLRDVVELCIHYFNNIRPIRKLNGKPPILFRTESVV